VAELFLEGSTANLELVILNRTNRKSLLTQLARNVRNVLKQEKTERTG